MNEQAFIRIEHLTKVFGKTIAVNNISLTGEKGGFITLLGPSGCGKTTMLRMIAGFIQPDKGRMYIGGKLLNELPVHRRETAMVFQSYALFPHLNVFNNVGYGLKLRKVSRSKRKEQVERVLKLVELEGMGNRQISQLSGGQQQRVALSRALAISPRVLLMDEPLSNLDAKLRINVRSQIRNLQQHLGITTIYVTHDQEEAFSLSDRIAIMKEGKLQQIGTPWEIYHNPRNQFIADFIGMTNFVEVKIETVDNQNVVLDFPGGKLIMFREKNLKFLPGQNILVTIRSEGIRVNKHIPISSNDNVLKGEIKKYSYTGKTVKYWVDVGGGITISVESFNPEEILVGKVYIAFDKFCIYPIFDKIK